MKPIAIAALLAGLACGLPPQAHAAGEDDPLLSMIKIDQLEYRDGPGHNPMVWGAEGWLGKDRHKLWLKTEGERVDGRTEESELQLLYGQAISPYWDLLLGWHHANLPRPDRDALVITLQGLAPYWIETELSLLVGKAGRHQLRLEAEYELMLTQRWVLTPELELSLASEADDAREMGSGLNHAEFGLRLGYEFRRELMPYVGVSWEKLYRGSADHARAEGERTEAGQWVIGVRLWF